jgi:hypothetical protein
MKAMRILALVLVVAGVLVLGVHGAQAGWYTCTVVQVGYGYGNAYISLTDTGGTFSGRWFLAESSSAKEILETALMASSASRTVSVNLTGTSQYNTIVAIYMNQ